MSNIIIDPHEVVITITANPTTGSVACQLSRPLEMAQVVYILGAVIVQSAGDAMLSVLRQEVGRAGQIDGALSGSGDGGRKDGKS